MCARAFLFRRRGVAWKLRALQVRPLEVLHGEQRRLRSHGSVDLHGDDGAFAQPGRRNL